MLPRHLSRRNLALAAVGALALFWSGLRFYGLDRAPPGFFMDEARGALHIACIAESGRSADGESWPLFTSGFGGGFYTPAFLYPGAAWQRLFGTSVAAMRAFIATYTLLTMLGLGLLANRLGGRILALWVVLAAALSPWAFQFSRIAWDPPLAPAFLVFGAYFLLRSPAWIWTVLSSLAFSLALYSYPPARIQGPLLLALFLWIDRKNLGWRRFALFAAVMGICCLPLARRMLDGTFLGRSNDLAIFSAAYLESHRGQLPASIFFVQALFNQLYLHLSPSFLFFSGDANLRHSTGFIGELGFLDTFGLAVILWAWCKQLAGQSRPSLDAAENRLLLVAIVCGVLGLLPAALTWEGVPHALRAIGAWPAWAMATGIALRAFTRRSVLRTWALVGLALMQTLFFVPRYFGPYAVAAQEAFHAELRDSLERGDRAAFARASRRYHPMETRYYLIAYDHQTCATSAAALQQLQSRPATPASSLTIRDPRQ